MSQDFLDGQYPLKSLFQSYTVSHYIKMSKTYWTHSTLIFFTLHSKNSSGRVTSSYLNQMVTQKWMRMCCKLTPDRLSFISIDITLHEISFLSSLFQERLRHQVCMYSYFLFLYLVKNTYRTITLTLTRSGPYMQKIGDLSRLQILFTML